MEVEEAGTDRIRQLRSQLEGEFTGGRRGAVGGEMGSRRRRAWGYGGENISPSPSPRGQNSDGGLFTM